MGLPELVLAILAGKVKPAISGGKTKLGELLFSQDEIRTLRPDCLSSTEFWQPAKIQEYLGLKKQVVFDMLNSGQLPLEKIQLPGRTPACIYLPKESGYQLQEAIYTAGRNSQQTWPFDKKGSTYSCLE